MFLSFIVNEFFLYFVAKFLTFSSRGNDLF